MRFNVVTLLIVVLATQVATSASHAEDVPPPAKSPLTIEQVHDIRQKWSVYLDRPLTVTNSIGMQLMLLPPGEFTMGRTETQFEELLRLIENDPESKKNRGGIVTWSMLMMPAHRVRLTKPFYMGTTEVTVAQFREFADASGYKTEAEQGLNGGVPYQGGRPISTWRRPMAWRKDYRQADDEPVMHLCWNDCVAFCIWLSEKEGVEYGLPTEAEWEYACRAGTTTPWSFGGFDISFAEGNKYAIWSEGDQKFDAPQRVAQRRPNAFGLYDMHGNMWEYVSDWWHEFGYKDAPLNNPTGPALPHERGDLRRIIRGSSFDWDRMGGDSAYRMRITQRSNQHPHMSFRVARRIKGVAGVAPLVDPDEPRRRQKRDPGTDSQEVLAALQGGAAKDELPKELTIDLGGNVMMEFVQVPAGSFLMGSENGSEDEQPLHRVVISKPFFMARHEVTQSQWEAVMGKHEWLTELAQGDNDMQGPDKAMNVLSWNDCQDFIGKLKSKVPGYSFALPTEAQWEYSCRAGSPTEFSFGNDESQLGEYAWFQGNMNWPGLPGYSGRTWYHDVGAKKPNAFGLYDMHGGVWEWCADRYDADYYLASSLVDPPGPTSGSFRVLRGGSWFRYGKYARSAFRRFFHPEGNGDGVTAWINDFGCRLVINPAEGRAAADDARNHEGEIQQLHRSAETLVKHNGNPVFGYGKPGAWDDGGCGCFSLSRVGDRFLLWYNASGKVQKKWQIGLAASTDGTEWKRSAANPIMNSGGMPSVYEDGGKFCMLYAAGGGFRLAESQDGIIWKQHGTGPVLRGIGESNDPCLRKFGDQFVLWYCGKVDGRYRILRATSPDCIRWELDPQPVIPLGEEADQCVAPSRSRLRATLHRVMRTTSLNDTTRP